MGDGEAGVAAAEGSGVTGAAVIARGESFGWGTGSATAVETGAGGSKPWDETAERLGDGKADVAVAEGSVVTGGAVLARQEGFGGGTDSATAVGTGVGGSKLLEEIADGLGNGETGVATTECSGATGGAVVVTSEGVALGRETDSATAVGTGVGGAEVCVGVGLRFGEAATTEEDDGSTRGAGVKVGVGDKAVRVMAGLGGG